MTIFHLRAPLRRRLTAVAGSVAVVLTLAACGPQQPEQPQQTQGSQGAAGGDLKPIPGLVDGVYFSEPSLLGRVWRLDVSGGGRTFVYSEFGCDANGDLRMREFSDIQLDAGRLLVEYNSDDSAELVVTVDGDQVILTDEKNEYFNSELQLTDSATAQRLNEEFCNAP